MLLNDDSSQGRKSFRHNTGNQSGFRLSKYNYYLLLYSSHINLLDFSGSVRTFRIGSRSVGLYPLVIGCLGVLNSILILTAVVIGIYCEYHWSTGKNDISGLST